MHPDDRHLYDAVTTAQSQGRGGTGEYRLAHEDGSIVHVFDRWHGVTRRDGVAVVEGVISDVTTMRTAEAAGRASAERFRVLAEAAPIGIYIADADGSIVYANDRWHQIYGLDGEQAFDDRWADAVHPEERATALDVWREAVRSGNAYEATLRLRKADGCETLIASRGAPMYDVNGAVMGYVGTDDAEIGAQIIARVGGLDAAIDAVRHHHERYDGTGYPERLEGDGIPIEARIAADAYSAITSDRPYARGRDQDQAFDELERSAGTHLDPVVAYAVRRTLEEQIESAAERLRRHEAA